MNILKQLRPIGNFILDLLRTSTFHGLNHIGATHRHICERLLWVALVMSCLYWSAILSSLTLTRYFENPTVISMERDRFSWNTSFPAATICPTTKIEEDRLIEYLNKADTNNKTALRDFIISLANANYENLETVREYTDIDPNNYMDLLVQLSFDFKPILSNSGVTGQHYNLVPTITEFGLCYGFNSQLAVYNSPSYWKANQWKVLKDDEIFAVNPLDGEVFANIVNMSTGYKLFIHGPYEVADVSSKVLNSPNGYFLQVYLTAMSIYSSERTRSLQVNQRKCRFHYESNLRHSPVYSYVLCRTECRLKLAKKLCGCLPHFYRKLDGDTVCDVKGLHCLAQHKDRLVGIKKECDCQNNCDEVNYVVSNYDSREWFLGSNLQWGLKEYPRMRLKRDVIFGFSDVLVYVGGMAGLFFGCSVLSFAELIYFFTLHLFFFAMQARKQKNLQKKKKDEIESKSEVKRAKVAWTDPKQESRHFNVVKFTKRNGKSQKVVVSSGRLGSIKQT